MSTHNLTKSLSNRYLIGQLMDRYTAALRAILLLVSYHLPKQAHGIRIWICLKY